jgi:hypothetical protein
MTRPEHAPLLFAFRTGRDLFRAPAPAAAEGRRSSRPGNRSATSSRFWRATGDEPGEPLRRPRRSGASSRAALLLTDSLIGAPAWLAGVPSGLAAGGRALPHAARVPRGGATIDGTRGRYRQLAAAAGIAPRSEIPAIDATPEESERAGTPRVRPRGANHPVRRRVPATGRQSSGNRSDSPRPRQAAPGAPTERRRPAGRRIAYGRVGGPGCAGRRRARSIDLSGVDRAG